MTLSSMISSANASSLWGKEYQALVLGAAQVCLSSLLPSGPFHRAPVSRCMLLVGLSNPYACLAAPNQSSSSLETSERVRRGGRKHTATSNNFRASTKKKNEQRVKKHGGNASSGLCKSKPQCNTDLRPTRTRENASKDTMPMRAAFRWEC